MLEPSNAFPSTNVSSSSSRIGTVKCCHIPGRSTNLRSTIFAPCSLANCSASSGVISFALLWHVCCYDYWNTGFYFDEIHLCILHKDSHFAEICLPMQSLQ